MRRTIALIIAIFTCILLGFHVHDVRSQLHEATVSYELSLASLKSIDANKASIWVYQNSSKIDREGVSLIVREAFKYKHSLLLLAIIHAESEFNLTAISNADAIGLGQIRWSVWGPSLIKHNIAHEKRDLYNPKINIAAMSYILEFYLEAKQGNIPQALEGYLGGQSKAYTDKISYSFLNLSMVKG